MKRSAYYVYLVFVVVCVGCGSDAPRIRDIVNAARRNLSPAAIDIAGVRLCQTEVDVKNRLASMQCQPKGNGIDVCTWKSTEEDRRRDFKGIDKLKLTFYRDSLQMIEVQYYEMFDVEYKNFDRSVREKYGYAIAGTLIDSSGCEWDYDALKVILIPHKKQHWTGTMFVFEPVLTFQDRTLYRRWLSEVEQRKPQTLY